MRRTFLFLFLLATLTLQAQTMSVEQVRDSWYNTSITGVGGGDIISLAKAFHRKFPTRAGKQLLATVAKKPSADAAKKSGYIGYADDVAEEMGSPEEMEVCVWRCDNGHRLFAVNFNSLEFDIHALCFFDYDPQTRTLKPEKALSDAITPKESQNYYINLPETGKEIHINEHIGERVNSYTYGWDGMKPVLKKKEVLGAN